MSTEARCCFAQSIENLSLIISLTSIRYRCIAVMMEIRMAGLSCRLYRPSCNEFRPSYNELLTAVNMKS